MYPKESKAEDKDYPLRSKFKKLNPILSIMKQTKIVLGNLMKRTNLLRSITRQVNNTLRNITRQTMN